MGKRILVIDDEESVRDAFVLALEETLYEVDTAASGTEGLEKALGWHPDLIFLDLRMPGMDGVEVLRRLHQCCRSIPVYIVTAFYQEYLKPLRQVVDEGIPFQLAKKPLSGEDIREVARGVLEGPHATPIDAPG